MEPVAIPQTIDDPIHILLWSADEIVPFMVCMLTGMLIDHFLPALAIGLIAVKFYRRFRDNRPDGYTLHALYWLGLLPNRAQTIPNCNGQQKPDTYSGSVFKIFPFEFERGLIAQC